MREKNVAASAKKTKPRLTINVMRMAGEWSKSMAGYSDSIRSWCKAALKGNNGNVSVVLADDATLRGLNRTFRGKDKPTNVLSFTGEGNELGDIVLAFETVKREAKEQKKSFKRHAAHLVVHGCLHLQGYDHERESDAEKMEKLEASILSGFGYPDPYNVAA